jgi:hypothetical protein
VRFTERRQHGGERSLTDSSWAAAHDPLQSLVWVGSLLESSRAAALRPVTMATGN